MVTYNGTTLEGFNVTFNELGNKQQVVTFKPSKATTAYYTSFIIQGVRNDDPSNRLLYTNIAPTTGENASLFEDEIFYMGKTSGSRSLQTKASVQAMYVVQAACQLLLKAEADNNFLKVVSSP